MNLGQVEIPAPANEASKPEDNGIHGLEYFASPEAQALVLANDEEAMRIIASETEQQT